MEMWKTAERFTHIPTALLQCLRRFSGLKEKRWQIGMACVKVELSRQNRKAGATLSAMNKKKKSAKLIFFISLNSVIQGKYTIKRKSNLIN